MAKRPSPRRRQRSIRLTVAAALLLLASAAVIAALISQALVWVSAAAVVSLVCAFAAARIIYLEMLQDRRDFAADRVVQARSYQDLAAGRSAEHAKFSGAMTARLGERNLTIRDLEGTIVLLEKRTEIAESRFATERERCRDLRGRVSELELQLDEPPAAIDGADWQADEIETVTDLLGWEERVMAQGSAFKHRKHA